jgi:hypothetical protein
MERAERRLIYLKLAQALQDLPGSLDDADEVIEACLICATGVGETLPHEQRVKTTTLKSWAASWPCSRYA